MRNFAAALLFLLLASACSHPAEQPEVPLRLSTNCDDSAGWINERFVQESTTAHSGKKVSLTDSMMPYSIGIRKKLKDISLNRLGSVIADAWVYSADSCPPRTLSLVVAVDDTSGNISWEGKPHFLSMADTCKWVHFVDTFQLPASMQLHHQLSGYLLNNSKNKVLVDDVSFEFFER